MQTTKAGAGSTSDSAYVLPMTVQALQVPVVDIGKIKAAIQGMSVDEARAYLSQFGGVDISMSPDWSGTMPGFDFRIDIQVVDPTSSGSGGPASSGTMAASATAAIVPAGLPSTATAEPQPAITTVDTPTPQATTPVPPASSDIPSYTPSESPSA